MTFPRLPPASRIAGAILAISALLVASACEPRRHAPQSVATLLSPEQETPQYRHLVLQNQLKVVLVSDPRADRSAASLSVATGSLEDPPERPGLAHFLEHMLFLGTEKYPQPGEYQAFMSRNAGTANAFTSDDRTNYHFEVAHASFPEALDRFAQFFIAPTLDEAYAQREMNAVDSEHAKNMENDFWRVRQIQRGHYKPGHPINRFSTGNLETLKGAGRAELLSFYNRYYSANRMAVAVIGKAGLDELEALARERFASIPNRRTEPVHYPAEYLARKAALRLLTVEPVADVRQLNVEFPLPATERYYRSKPLSVIASIIGHEGAGSLLSLLKADGLAISLSAGGGENTLDYSSFHVSIGLTPRGLEQYEAVLGRLLGALRALARSSIPRYLHEELRTMAELGYRYQERMESARLAILVSESMHIYPLSEIPRALHVVSEYKPALYAALLSAMTPDNMLVTLVAKGVPVDKTEKYYRARFGYREIVGPDYARLEPASTEPRWHVPIPNPFIPRETALIPPRGPLRMTDTTFRRLRAGGVSQGVLKDLEPLRGITFTGGEALLRQINDAGIAERPENIAQQALQNSLALPTRLLDTPIASVWYLPDWKFRQPRAELLLNIFTEGASGAPREAILARLYDTALDEALNEFSYPVKEAGLSFDLSASKSGFVLRLGGYSPRLLDLLESLAQRLRTVDLSEERFASVKERVRRQLENRRFQQPYEQSRYYKELLIEQPAFAVEALMEAMAPLTLTDVQRFAKRAYRRIHVQGVVAGNVEPGPVRDALESLFRVLEAAPLPENARVQERVRTLPARADQVFSQRLAVENSSIEVYFQAGETNPTRRGALLIAARKLQDSYYESARTQQQLGYIVWGGMSQIQKTLGLSLLIQSGAYPADLLLERTDAFVRGFIAEFKALPEAAFNAYRGAVIQAKLERENTLSSIAGRLMWVAFKNDAQWDYVSEDIRAVEALTRQDVQREIERVFTGPESRRLVLRLIGKNHTAKPPKGQAIQLPTAVKTAALP